MAREISQTSASMRVRRIVAHTVLIIASLLCMVWFYILIINATRTHSDLQVGGFAALPGTNFINNFNNMLHSDLPIFRGLINSLIVAVGTAVLTVYFSTMTAYAIHVYNFKGKKAIFTFILMIMMIPTQVTALGFLQLIDKMHLMDSFIPLIVPAIAAPAVFYYMKQYMDASLPLEIIEAGRIDGASEPRIFNTVILPIMKPAIAVQAIFAFVSSWNNYFTPALVLETQEKKTLPILIAQLRDADFLKQDMGQVYMMIAFAIFPVVLVYIVLSKNIVQGIALGSVKG